MEDTMWWLEVMVICFLCAEGFACANAAREAFNEEPYGDSLFLAVVVLLAGGMLAFVDGEIRSHIWGCAELKHGIVGLEKNTPYSTLSTMKVGDKVYAFVRLVDQQDKQPVRCVYADAETPRIFSVGSDNSIITLSTTPAK